MPSTNHEKRRKKKIWWVDIVNTENEENIENVKRSSKDWKAENELNAGGKMKGV